MAPKKTIDWNAYGYCRAFTNWALPDETPEESAKTLAAWNAEAMVKKLVAAGVNNFTIDARSQWSAHYPSKITRQAPLLEGRDIFGELLAAGKKHGLRIVAYIPTGSCGLCTVEHPDWAVRDRCGKPLRFGKTSFYRACTNSGYRQFEIDCQKELLVNYPDVAGLWYDGPGYASDCYGALHCFCPGCRKSFADRYGYPIPEEAAWETTQWADFLDWRIQCSIDVLRAYYQAVKRVRPDIPITANVGFQGWAGPAEELCQWLDQAGMEIGYHDSAFLMAVMKAAMGAKPIEAYTHSRGLPEAEVRYRAQFVLTHGGMPNFTPGNGESLKRAYADINSRLDICRDAQPMRWSALVHSRKTRNFHNRGAYGFIGYKYESYGQFAMLGDEHLPGSIMLDRDLSEGDLSQYRVIVLPDTAVIDQLAADRLRAFVEAGGGLLATQHAALRDPIGRQLPSFLLEDVFGVRYAGGPIQSAGADTVDGVQPPENNNYPAIGWQLTNHAVFNDPLIQSCFKTLDWNSLQHHGLLTLVEALPKTEVIARANNSPLVTVREFGKGRVAYIACDIGVAYRHEPLAWLHRIYGNLIRYIARSTPPVEIIVPSYCKAGFFEHGNQLIIHLLSDPYPFNRWSNCRKLREDTFPVANVRLIAHTPVAAARCLPSGKSLNINREGNDIIVKIPEFDDHVIIVLEKT